MKALHHWGGRGALLYAGPQYRTFTSCIVNVAISLHFRTPVAKSGWSNAGEERLVSTESQLKPT